MFRPSQHSLKKRITKTIEWLSGFNPSTQPPKRRKPKNAEENTDEGDQVEITKTESEPRLDYDFVILYHVEPDNTGHSAGPDHENVTQELIEIDSSIGTIFDKLKNLLKHSFNFYSKIFKKFSVLQSFSLFVCFLSFAEQLMSGLTARGLLDKVNVIITSDHGMTPVIKKIDISNIIPQNSFKDFDLLYKSNFSKYRISGNSSDLNLFSDQENDILVVEDGAILSLVVRNGTQKRKLEIVANLQTALKGSAVVYLKENIPRRFRYSLHRRIPDIVAIANEGIMLVCDV